MRRIELDLAHIATVRALHIYLRFMLDLPEYYGGNLDALYDCLTDIGEETELCVLGGGEASAEMAAYGPRLWRVLEDAQRENEKLKVTRG